MRGAALESFCGLPRRLPASLADNSTSTGHAERNARGRGARCEGEEGGRAHVLLTEGRAGQQAGEHGEGLHCG